MAPLFLSHLAPNLRRLAPHALRAALGHWRVGREGFTWSGTERISRMKEWPDWFPPSQMIERQPYLPRVMAGGPGNPLGARALYLGNTSCRLGQRKTSLAPTRRAKRCLDRRPATC
jgi:lipoprotein-anchoring transpeptidase ErfK/SrfK